MRIINGRIDSFDARRKRIFIRRNRDIARTCNAIAARNLPKLSTLLEPNALCTPEIPVLIAARTELK